ncbi:SH3 domain-containing protein [Defluviimonas sp. SAOS-178_SWC]|uniref:SH3 domain-containing protein n=1 Tax=Defluviimonas sp. SAOS-178_SWC TaxID=3121287 RepID=UPI0032219B3E
MKLLHAVATGLVIGLAAVSGDRAEAAGAARAVGAPVLSPSLSLPQRFDTERFLIEVQGGPDFWVMTGVPAGDTLNMRSGPGTGYGVIARAQNGQIFRNLGCRGSGNSRWCDVETKSGSVRGWVSGRYLQESGGGASTGSASGDVPELALRSGGEIEVRWGSGCTMLYNPRGNRIQSGSSCSRSQRSRSDDAVARHLREQGGSTAEGGGGAVDMRGVGLLTQGGPLIGRITSKNWRSYALNLTATRDGFTCTGSFDEAPGSRNSMSTSIHCMNGDSGSAILKGELLTFSAGGKGGYVRF